MPGSHIVNREGTFMAHTELPVETGGGPAKSNKAMARITGAVAICGGLLALAVACLATASVLSRWLFNAPIEGDFEYVKMATAVAIFAYLPYTQARRGNIVVDTFTMGITNTTRRRIDAFWDLAYAGFAAFLTYALLNGTMDAVRSGETTMQKQLLIWPSIGLSMLLCGLLAITSIATALERLKPEDGGDAS